MNPAYKTQRPTKVYSPKRRFAIAPRRPWHLPETEIQIEAPEPLPSPPANINGISVLLPVVLMAGGMGAYAFMFKGSNPWMMLPMLLMGLGFPIANVLSVFSERKRYQRAMEARQEKYLSYLRETRRQIEALIRQQSLTFHQEYPEVSQLLEWARSARKNRRLWWRRLEDKDFLSLRAGTGSAPPAFRIVPPTFGDAKDPLQESAFQLIADYRMLKGMPLLVDLKRAGSLAVTADDPKKADGLIYRLLIDAMFHHAPSDLEFVVLDPQGESAAARWGWLKWAPHTVALEFESSRPHLAFSRQRADEALEWVMKAYYRRKSRKEAGGISNPALLILVGESPWLRRSVDIVELAEEGHDVGIFLIFVGGRGVPRECRAQVRIKQKMFEYMETWAVEEEPLVLRGAVELASRREGEQIARALAPLEPSTGRQHREHLPERVSLFDVLELSPVDQEGMEKRLRKNWSRRYPPRQTLQFPFGLYFDRRRGLKPATLNLLPEEYGGIGAYHSILVGTTGSGKSEFMKTLVLAAAYRYSPRQLNFFFMDFKGGSAFNIFQALPHTVGVVTNLSPDLVVRGLNAIEYELEHRQKQLAEAGVPNIWAYNEGRNEHLMPHLLLLLDEFARGMEDFEQLPELLNRLVRIGRSLGMYLFLANQDVTPAVDRLLNNVGWRIALKVARPEEMNIIERHLPIAERGKGEGYLYSTLSPDGAPPIKFQAGYAGFTIYGKRDASFRSYKIYEIEDDGLWSVFDEIETATVEQGEEITEQALLLSAAERLMAEDPALKAHPIYLAPLPSRIMLNEILDEASPALAFNLETQRWHPVKRSTPWAIPIGRLDSPEQRLQEILRVDFNAKDGHLWILGAPDSGVAATLKTLLLSLAFLKTPEEAQIYVIEGGASRLREVEDLPHVGAVVRLKEKERVERLLKFLDEEIERRAVERGGSWPHLFLIIDGYAGFRSRFDENDRIAQYAQIGKSVGLHLIVTTNRRADLWSGVADNISRRLVLYLSSPDEYTEALDARVKPFTHMVAGRGYWRDGHLYFCQVAMPQIREEGRQYSADQLAKMLRSQWAGAHPQPIRTLPSCLPLAKLIDALEREKDAIVVPVGLAFEDLQPVMIDLSVDAPNEWVILGGRQTGKTNFLTALAQVLAGVYASAAEVFFFGFKGGTSLALPSSVQVYQRESILQGLQSLRERITTESKREVFLLLDDLGVGLGKEAFKEELGEWVSFEEQWERVHVIATGVSGSLQPHLMHPLIRRLRQNGVGIVLGKDQDALSWLSASLPRQYFRQRFPKGRGLWVSGGQALLLQTPKAGPC